MTTTEQPRAFHPNFDAIDAHKCEFFAIRSATHTTCAIFHSSWNRFIGFERVASACVHDFFSYWENTHTGALKNFKRKYIVYDTPYASFIPSELWHEGVTDSFTQLSQLSPSEHISLGDYIAPLGGYNLYAISKRTHLDMMECLGGDLRFWHIQNFFFKEPTPIKWKDKKHVVYLHIVDGGFWIIVHCEERIVFIKRYTTLIPDEVGYFVFSVCKHYSVQVDAAQFVLDGMIDTTKNPIFDVLRPYLTNVHLSNLPKSFDYEQSILNYPHHYFSLLFQLNVCVLSGGTWAD